MVHKEEIVRDWLPRYTEILPAILLLSVTALDGQLTVRNAVSDTEGNPGFMVDGNPSTEWSSEARGDAASLLLDEPMALRARYVVATGNEEPAAFQLLASTNYRDWTLVGEGNGYSTESPGDIATTPTMTARYLRLVSLAGEPVSWEVFAGSRESVETQLKLYEPVDWGDITDPANIADMVNLAFDWQMEHLSTRQDAIGWVNGAFFSGVSGVYGATGNPEYRQAILDIGNSVDWTLRERTSGKRFYHADDHCIGQSWLELYMLEPDGQERWIADVRDRMDRVMADPLPGRQDMNWCDALYMSPPVYSRLYAITGDEAYLTFIDDQWWDVTDFLYDPEYGLFYRDDSYIDDREPNGMPVFWSRGNGWVIGGLVRLIEYFPEDWPGKAAYEDLLTDMATALASIQGPEDGLWSSSLLYPEKYDGERETSGSAFFTYAIAWGVNEGILDAEVFGPVIEKAWEGLTTMLNRNGTLDFIQQIGAGPARNNGEFTNKDYGYGAFLLAGIEMMRYYGNANDSWPRGPYARMEAGSLAVIGEPDAWELVDDFEGGFNWSVRKNVTYSESLVGDPFDPTGSRVFSIYTGSSTPGEYRATTRIPSIPEGGTATVYQRFSYDNPEIDVLMGISDFSVVDSYSDYENGLRVYYEYNQMEARSGGRYERIGDDLLQLETWYEAWTVIDNGADTYDVYLKGGGNYPEITLLASDIPFRNGTNSSILSYAISYNTDWCEGTFYLDDVYINPGGINLTRPANVRQPVYSPWSEVGRDPDTMAKSTSAGTLWDNAFPWVYHWQLGSWCYVHPQEVYQGGWWVWNLESAGWIWISSAWPGLAYDAGRGSWFVMG